MQSQRRLLCSLTPPIIQHLENEPHIQLDQAAGTSRADISEMTFGIGLAVVDDTGSVAQKGAAAVVHTAPLGVIESVEGIGANLNFLAFAERLERLLQSHIPVIGSGLADTITMFVTARHREVRDALIEVERIRAGGRLGV